MQRPHPARAALTTFVATCALMICVSLAAAPARAQNLVTNGNFAVTGGSTSFQFGSYNGYSYSGETLAGWTSTGYNFVFLPASTIATGTYGSLSLWNPTSSTPSANGFTNAGPTGGNYIGADSSGGYNGAITQTINGLVVGKTYAVSFAWAGAQQYSYNGGTTEQWQVSLGGGTQSTQIINVANHGFSGWMTQTFNYVATSTSELLSFLALGTPSGVPPFALLTNVSVTQVPEPSTWMMMASGLVGLVGVARRRVGKRRK